MAHIDEISDESLMERVQTHDHQAFSQLVTRHSDKFYGAAYRVVMNTPEAEDIVQEAFLKLWDNPKIWKANKGAKFTSWFYKIVMNISIDKYRKNKKQSYAEFKEEEFDHEPEQESTMINRQEQKGLEIAIQSLPEKQMMALNLCFYEGLSNKEAANIMDVNVKALESLLMRAKTGVKDYLYRAGILNKGEAA